MRRKPAVPASAFLVVVLAVSMLTSGCTARRDPAPAPRELRVTARQVLEGPVAATIVSLASRARSQGKTLVIPSGDYRVTSTITLPAGASVRLSDDARLVGTLPGAPVVRLAARSTLEGGLVSNDSPQPGFGVDFAPGAVGVAVRRVTFTGPAINAVYLDAAGLRDVLVEGCAFRKVGYGVLLNPGASDAVGITIRRNLFVGVAADAVEVNNATGGGSSRVRRVVIESNRMRTFAGGGESSGFGVGVAGAEQVAIVRNRIDGVRNEAVHLEDGTSGVTVRGNVVRSGGSGSRAAIAIYRSTADVSVSTNTIDGFDGNGIAVQWDPQGSARRVTVESNRLDRVTGDCVVLAGDRGTGPFRAIDNVLRGCGHGGVVLAGGHDLSTVVGNVIDQPGGPAITETLRGTGRTILRENSVTDSP